MSKLNTVTDSLQFLDLLLLVDDHNGPGRSVCGLGFGVVFDGHLENPLRGDDLRFGWLQDRVPTRRPRGAHGLAAANPVQVSAMRHLPLTLIQLGPERLMLGGQVSDPSGSLGDLALWPWGRVLALVVAGGALFGGTERLDLPVRIAAE